MTEEIYIGEQPTSSEISKLTELLENYIEPFSINGKCGETTSIEHTIELLPNTKPFAEPLRRRAPAQVEETRRQVDLLLQQGIIEESISPWASAYVLAKKKSGEYRLCIDFRRLNDATKKTSYPLPNIEDCLDTISGMNHYTKLDFASGF